MTLQSVELPFITKVLIPKRRDYVIPRGRLLDRMQAGLGKRAQVISAPAGYGKTALLVEFASESDLPVCWYSFSPEDYDPLTFLLYCLRSVRDQIPSFGEDLGPLINGSLNSDWRTQFGYFISALHTGISRQIVFVLDDLHWIQEKGELEEAISLFVQRAPPNVRFILSSRSWPTLSCVPKLAAEADLESYDVRDLRFTADDTVQLLGGLWERSVTAEEAGAICDRTGGWAAAIMLTGKNESGLALPDDVNIGDAGMMFDYLSEEVFRNLPEALQRFLLRSSILREFTVAVCERLLGVASPQALVDEIRDRGLFLEERAGGGAAYGFHDLFREYLERRFHSEEPSEHQALNLGAGELYLELGDDDAAIYHFLKAGDPGRAAQIVREVGAAYFARGRWQRLGSWLSRLPREVAENDPDLLLLHGQVLLRLGNPTESMEQLDKLVSGPHSGDPQVLGKALIAKSTAYRRLGHLDLAKSAAEDGISLLEQTECSSEFLSDGYKQLGNAFYQQGAYETAKQHLQTALGLTSKESLRLFSMICNDLGITYMELGELDQAAVYLDQSRVGQLKLASDGPLANTLINLALVYYQRGEFDLALDENSEALRIAQAANDPRVVATGLMNQGIIQQALGAYAESLSSASRALDMSRALLDQRLIAESTKVLGNAYRKLGEISKAELLLTQAVLEAEDSDQKYIAASYRITLGKVYWQLGDDARALERLRVAEGELIELSSFRRVAESKLFQAAVHYKAGDLKRARDCLSEVAGRVSDLGYDGFLLADGDEVLDALRFGAARRIGGDVFTRLIERVTRNAASEDSAGGGLSGIVRPASLPPLRVFGFGNPTVLLDTHEVTDAEWRSRKAKELFFLLLCQKQPLPNEEVLESLWPEVSLDLSASALKTNIYRLRQALFFDCVVAKDSGYCINPDVSIEFDVANFLDVLKPGAGSRAGGRRQEGRLSQAIEMYRGPFLNGFYSEWCQAFRSDLELKYHTALMNLASYHSARGKFAQASDLLERVVHVDPYDEEAQYQLIESYVRGGEPFAALQQLRRYSRISLEELGTDLPKRFLDCHQRILQLTPNAPP